MSIANGDLDGERPAITARQLQQARQLTGLSQRDLAEKANISATSISNIERGYTRNPRAKTVRAIVDVLRHHGVEFAPGGWARLLPPVVRASRIATNRAQPPSRPMTRHERIAFAQNITVIGDDVIAPNAPLHARTPDWQLTDLALLLDLMYGHTHMPILRDRVRRAARTHRIAVYQVIRGKRERERQALEPSILGAVFDHGLDPVRAALLSRLSEHQATTWRILLESTLAREIDPLAAMRIIGAGLVVELAIGARRTDKGER